MKEDASEIARQDMATIKAPLVDHPAHYNVGKIEVIDAIEDWKLGFSPGNAVKYIARHQYKENPIQDLEKAAWYLRREIERLKKDLANGQN